jgi:plasmid stabilization system protein ParE
VSYQVQVLAYAKDDYREIRAYVKRKFGDQVWVTVEAEFKEMHKQIAEMPFARSVPEEIEAIWSDPVSSAPSGENKGYLSD